MYISIAVSSLDRIISTMPTTEAELFQTWLNGRVRNDTHFMLTRTEVYIMEEYFKCNLSSLAMGRTVHASSMIMSVLRTDVEKAQKNKPTKWLKKWSRIFFTS